MARVDFASGPTQITNAAATLLAGSTTLDTVILEIIIVNTSTSSVTLRLSKATSTTVSAATALVYDLPIPPNSTLIIRGPIIIPDAGTAVNINGLAGTTNVLTWSASGFTEST